MRWPWQPFQPFQKHTLQPLFGSSVDSLCHSWFTTTNLSYRFPIFETSATASCGTTGVCVCIYIYIYTYYIHMFMDQIYFWSHHKAAEQCWTFSTCHFQNGGQCWPHWHSLFFSAATLEIACHIWWFLSEVSARGSQLPCGKLKMKSFSNQDISFKSTSCECSYASSCNSVKLC